MYAHCIESFLIGHFLDLISCDRLLSGEPKSSAQFAPGNGEYNRFWKCESTMSRLVPGLLTGLMISKDKEIVAECSTI